MKQTKMSIQGNILSKITKIVGNSVKQVEYSSSERSKLFNGYLKLLKEDKKTNTASLKLIEEQYLTSLKEYKGCYNSLQEEFKVIDNELQEAIAKFNKLYNYDDEKEKLEKSKLKGLYPKLLVHRKKMKDKKLEIEKMTKEQDDAIKAINDNFNDKKNTYISKKKDIFKKLKFNLTRIDDNVFKETSDSEKKLSESNDRKEIKMLTKKIKVFKKAAILEAKDIKLQCLKELNEKDLEFFKVESSYLEEVFRAKAKYEKIINLLNTDEKMEKLNYEIEGDKYDFGSKRALNNLHLKMTKKKNKFITANKLTKLEKIKAFKETEVDFLNKLKGINIAFTKKQDQFHPHYLSNTQKQTGSMFETYKKDAVSFEESIILVTRAIMQMIQEVFKRYLDFIIDAEYDNFRVIYIDKHSYNAINDYDYKTYVEKLEAHYNQFKEKINKEEEEFKANVNNHLNTIINDLQNMFKTLQEKLFKLSDIKREYNEEFSRMIAQDNIDIVNYSSKYYQEKIDDTSEIKAITEECNIAKEEIITENEAALSEKAKNDELLDNEIKEYNDRKVIEREKMINAVEDLNIKVDERLEKEITDNKVNYENKVKDNKEKYITSVNDANEEYKTKIKLL